MIRWSEATGALQRKRRETSKEGRDQEETEQEKNQDTETADLESLWPALDHLTCRCNSKVIMDLVNFTDLLNVSTLVRNSTHFAVPASNVVIAFLLCMSVIIATTYLQDNHWSFGNAMCKVFNATLSAGMFASIFFLSAISVDRYLLTLHPVWSQLHRTPRWATGIILGIWLSATALGMPYLVFRETQDDHKGRVTCQNNYAASPNWESKKMQTLGKGIHVACFISRFLLGFLLPFFIISICYKRVADKMKERGLFKSNKPFRVMVTAILSFFVCWMPYHVHQGLLLTKHQSVLVQVTQILTVITISFNELFSPTLYLFTGENFKNIFKKSILALFESTFSEDSLAERTQNLNSEAYI
ncbi:probable G-protein coupled receptor 33 isoform X4 [Zalophus californianus]|uniref:Probable G-protein coupled receptor 33 n=1 Tax=Zalophus californianus TaxID=9704 RepID=A0A6J2B9S6_ZALCA|nr:probable G-protein coupled receptor 33 isoform X4 [Zalophus californianus]